MSILEDWNMRHFERYLEQVARGEHDRHCEQRERSSLCHCHKRKRESEGKTELPTILFPPPECTGCGKDVEFAGDNFTCPTCAASWDENATDGDAAATWIDDHGTGPWGGEQFGQRLIEKAWART